MIFDFDFSTYLYLRYFGSPVTLEGYSSLCNSLLLSGQGFRESRTTKRPVKNPLLELNFPRLILVIEDFSPCMCLSPEFPYPGPSGVSLPRSQSQSVLVVCRSYELLWDHYTSSGIDVESFCKSSYTTTYYPWKKGTHFFRKILTFLSKINCVMVLYLHTTIQRLQV